MSDLNVRAVLIGEIVDSLGSMIVSIIFTAAVATWSGATTPEDLVLIFDGSPGLQATQLALGLALTASGAYVAAMLANEQQRKHAFAVGVISTVLGFLFAFSAPESAPFWVQAMGLVLTVPAAFVGGEIRLLVVRMRRS